jgi:anti-sigma regulatory factor (Ser/Thr protein kinase)
MTAPTEPIMRHAGLAFVGEVASIPTARNFAAGKTKEWDSSVLRDDISLMVSELVTNAVRHAKGGGTLDLVELECGGVHVEVSDGSTAVPVVGRGGLCDASGRGMRIVDSLASSWGVVSRREGKSVWFELIPGGCAP